MFYFLLNLSCLARILIVDQAINEGPYLGITLFFFLVIKALFVIAEQ